MLYLVGFTGTQVAGTIIAASLAVVPWSSLRPGDSVLLYSGVTPANVYTILGAKGTKEQPIIVTSVDSANQAGTKTLDVQQSEYVYFSMLSSSSAPYGAFIFRNGSHHCKVNSCTISGAAIGINITQGAGTGFDISGNTIANSTTLGISIDGVNSDAADRTIVTNNTITGSGSHGMEVRGSYYKIERNNINGNGTAIGGTSGIHIYSRALGDGTGVGNIVRHNYCWGQKDTTLYDGNGIEIDQWCNGNQVQFNVCYANDGAGIISYDSAENMITNNTCHGNGLNSGGTHVALGQLIINASNPVWSRRNQVYNNVCTSTLSTVPAMYVNPTAISGGQEIEANLLYTFASGGHLLRWTDSAYYDTSTTIASATGYGGWNTNNPNYTAVGSPGPGSDGLAMSSLPNPGGRYTDAGNRDMLFLEARVSGGQMGAYYFNS
jgi:parallel beta-helix repeat protein